MIDINKLDCVYEKKYWISITGLCNNNCKFCLDSNRCDKNHKNLNKIKEEIKLASKKNSKLIISGGDPTIHPELEQIIKFSKEQGFKKIQLITNGRMFASKEFTEKIISAGITEVTFSVHGHNSKIHDHLTSVPGSFKQIIKGILNIKNNSSNKQIILNTDTCVTKYNYKDILKTIKFVYEILGINEINLMTMLPEGNAWKYKEDIIINPKLTAPYIKEVLNYSIKNNINLWLSRFPAKYLENYERFIEDPYKAIDEVRGRKQMFETKNLLCKGDKCDYCPIKQICNKLVLFEQIKQEQLHLNKYSKKISLELNNIEEINNSSKELIILTPNSHTKLKNFNKEETYSILLPKLTISKNIRLANTPLCVLKKYGFNQYEYIEFFNESLDEKKDLLEITKIFSKYSTTHLEKCDTCKYKKSCPGPNINYIRINGSKEFSPFN